MEITAAYVPGLGAGFDVTTLDLDGPGPREVLVRVVASGICASDAHARSGSLPAPLPAVLGHEGAGVVEAVGAGSTTSSPVTMSCCPGCRTAAPAGSARTAARSSARPRCPT